MRRLLVASVAVAALTLSAPNSAAAQQACSPVNLAAADACATGADFLRYMAPQLGTALVGGSHTLGLGSNLGGFPHFAVALRANAVMGSLPELGNLAVGAATSRNYNVTNQPLALPALDFSIGVTEGFSVGVTKIGGIDIIGGATFVPEVDGSDFSLAAPDGSLAIAYGLRVGLLQQSVLVPGVAFSWMKRDMPTLNLVTSPSAGDEIAVNNLSLKTSSWRLSAQKNLLLFQFGAGFGQDSYDFDADVAVQVTQSPAPVVNAAFNAAQAMTRTSVYGNVGMNLLLLKLVVEVGQVSGGDAPTFHTYDKAANASRLYGTAGLRFSF